MNTLDRAEEQAEEKCIFMPNADWWYLSPQTGAFVLMYGACTYLYLVLHAHTRIHTHTHTNTHAHRLRGCCLIDQ